MPEIVETRVPQGAQIYTVTELNRTARELLEDELPSLWVAGEISNLARPGSGHIYFSLTDAEAQVRCAMFRGANRALQFPPEDGLQVIAGGRVTIYEPRGSYQLIVEHMEPAGEGLLRRKLDELKQKLAAEGLFDPVHKQPLPTLPQRIGIVTSPTGAVVHDILHILRRRFAPSTAARYSLRARRFGAPRRRHSEHAVRDDTSTPSIAPCARQRSRSCLRHAPTEHHRPHQRAPRADASRP